MAKHTKKRVIHRACRQCGEPFITGASIKHHCSPECRVREVAGDFISVAGCWDWPRSKNPVTGYGQLSEWVDGKRMLLTAHRVSFAAHRGAVPDGQMVCHTCDNRACFNPAHLFLGTQTDNMSDCAAKGRNGHTRLSASDAVAILNSSEKLRVLAARYGVTLTCISAVRTGRTWRHVSRAAISSTDSR